MYVRSSIILPHCEDLLILAGEPKLQNVQLELSREPVFGLRQGLCNLRVSHSFVLHKSMLQYPDKHRTSSCHVHVACTNH